MAVSTS